ncbi:hypothetical protein BJ684DRAFT_19932 [Piptocephalis cylindrospora]|uniref:PH domain-containing protein n=1 Tax=Piptocephalis cylindrospora TaxID=1907219 RepID=A0A4P9Y3S1_9FUNG|nr:hypothetical protein BJ684DRAFT_19932 [Piptocephalis cylindrospora]|eukprot:RKP13586.1 hypothetical protein BJ684DRAFT_19932 [Piptocephalis cylindrospora]
MAQPIPVAQSLETPGASGSQTKSPLQNPLYPSSLGMVDHRPKECSDGYFPPISPRPLNTNASSSSFVPPRCGKSAQSTAHKDKMDTNDASEQTNQSKGKSESQLPALPQLHAPTTRYVIGPPVREWDRRSNPASPASPVAILSDSMVSRGFWCPCGHLAGTTIRTNVTADMADAMQSLVTTPMTEYSIKGSNKSRRWGKTSSKYPRSRKQYSHPTSPRKQYSLPTSPRFGPPSSAFLPMTGPSMSFSPPRSDGVLKAGHLPPFTAPVVPYCQTPSQVSLASLTSPRSLPPTRLYPLSIHPGTPATGRDSFHTASGSSYISSSSSSSSPPHSPLIPTRPIMHRGQTSYQTAYPIQEESEGSSIQEFADGPTHALIPRMDTPPVQDQTRTLKSRASQPSLPSSSTSLAPQDPSAADPQGSRPLRKQHSEMAIPSSPVSNTPHPAPVKSKTALQTGKSFLPQSLRRLACSPVPPGGSPEQQEGREEPPVIMSRLLWKRDTEGHPGMYTTADARHKHPTDIWKEWVTVLMPSGQLCSYRGYPYERDQWRMKGKKAPRPDHSLHLSLSLESERTFIIRAPTHELTTAWFRALRLWDPSGMVTSPPTSYPHPSHLGILAAPATVASGEGEDAGASPSNMGIDPTSKMGVDPTSRMGLGLSTTSPQAQSGTVDPQRSVVDVRIPELGGIRVRICLEGVGVSALLLREVALIRAREAASNSSWAWWSGREVWLGWRKGGRFEWCRPQEWINTEEGRYGRGYRLEMRSAPHTGCGGVRIRGSSKVVWARENAFNIRDEEEEGERAEEAEGDGLWIPKEPPWVEGILEMVTEAREGEKKRKREGGDASSSAPTRPVSWKPVRYRFGKTIRRHRGQERGATRKKKTTKMVTRTTTTMKARPRRMWYGTRDGLLLWAPISRIDLEGQGVQCDEEHRAVLEPGCPDQALSLIHEATGALDLTRVDRVELVGPKVLEVEAVGRVRKLRAWDEAGAQDWVRGLAKAVRYWRAQARAKQEALESASLGILGGTWQHEQLWPVCPLLGCRPVLASGILYAPTGRGMCGGGAGGKELGGGEGESRPPGAGGGGKGGTSARIRFERFHGLLLSNGSLQLFRPARCGGPAFLRRGRHVSVHGTYILSRPHLPGEERAAARAVTRYYGDGVEMLMWTTMAQAVVERQVRGVIRSIGPGDWGAEEEQPTMPSPSSPPLDANQVRIIYPPRMVMEIPAASFDDLGIELDRVAETMGKQELESFSQKDPPDQHVGHVGDGGYNGVTPISPPTRPSVPAPVPSYLQDREMNRNVITPPPKEPHPPKSSSSFGWLRAGKKLGTVRERMSRKLVTRKGSKIVDEPPSPTTAKAAISTPLELTPPGTPRALHSSGNAPLPRGVLHEFRPISTCTTDTALIDEPQPPKADTTLMGPRENPFQSSTHSSSVSSSRNPSRAPSMREIPKPHTPTSTASDPSRSLSTRETPRPHITTMTASDPSSSKTHKPLPDPSTLPIPRSPGRSQSGSSRSGMADPKRNTVFDRELNASRDRAAYAHAMDFDDEEEDN